MTPLTEKQLATTLAALRYWQEQTEDRETSLPRFAGQYFTEVAPLDDAGIDALCEQINAPYDDAVTLSAVEGVGASGCPKHPVRYHGCVDCTAKAVGNGTATVADVLKGTDWQLLRGQKLLLMLLAGSAHDRDDNAEADSLDGLVSWLDALQDAAHVEGYPVVFLTENDNEDDEDDSQSGDIYREADSGDLGTTCDDCGKDILPGEDIVESPETNGVRHSECEADYCDHCNKPLESRIAKGDNVYCSQRCADEDTDEAIALRHCTECGALLIGEPPLDSAGNPTPRMCLECVQGHPVTPPLFCIKWRKVAGKGRWCNWDTSKVYVVKTDAEKRFPAIEAVTPGCELKVAEVKQ